MVQMVAGYRGAGALPARTDSVQDGVAHPCRQVGARLYRWYRHRPRVGYAHRSRRAVLR